MALSSDEIIKREIVNKFGTKINGLKLRVFPQSSTDDQKMFSDGGLTFGSNGVAYGSCDACWHREEEWIDGYKGKKCKYKPIIALEGTDALNRGSSGNAQYQRFHHALGAVKNGLIGIYYLKKGIHKIQEDLYGMAYFVSKYEDGDYLIIDDINELEDLLKVVHDAKKTKIFIDKKKEAMYDVFQNKFKIKYKTWNKFAEKRSTIIKDSYIIKYAGRMKRNFTDSSQRAGHIAVGEMFLTKYFFFDKTFYYLWPKMTKEDIEYLDKHKSNDKEWYLLRNEENVQIISIDDLENVPSNVVNDFKSIRNEPLKGDVLRLYHKNIKILRKGLISSTIKLKIN